MIMVEGSPVDPLARVGDGSGRITDVRGILMGFGFEFRMHASVSWSRLLRHVKAAAAA